MQSLNDKSGYYAVILFFIWPLLALASAFKNYKASWGKNILWAFVAFYGFSFAIGAESEGSDIVRYVQEVEYLHGIEMSFVDAIQYYQESGEIDILRTFLAITVSRITGEKAILILIYGIIFGYFFSRNLWFVLERLEGKIKPITVLLFICFFLVLPIWKINGFRMWTAAHIFIYGLLQFLFEGKKRGVAVAAASILVHFSFIVPMGVLLGYLALGNRLTLYFGLFVATFFISEINIDTFNNFIEGYAPEILQERTSSYRAENQVEMYREGGGEDRIWYVVWHERGLYWAITAFLVIFYFKGRDFFEKHKKWLSLICFTLLLTSAVNLLNSIPSGGRFFDIAYMIALALIILYVQNYEHGNFMERLVWVTAPALMLFVVVAFRIGLYSMSATAVLGNPVIAILFMGEHISLNDVMKMIL